MTTSPLFRVPCILVAMVGINTTSTPPQPPPRSEESAPSTILESVLKQRFLTLVVRSTSWGFALAEIAVIVASTFPQYEASKTILSKLVFPGSPTNVSSTKWFFIGTFMSAFGGYIRWSCYRTLGKFFTFEMSIRNDHKLVTNGPYAWVRHPGYTGVLLTLVGQAIWFGTKGSYIRECVFNSYIGKGAALILTSVSVTILSGLLARMSKEDEALRKKFGKQWDEWSQRVPCKLIPWVF